MDIFPTGHRPLGLNFKFIKMTPNLFRLGIYGDPGHSLYQTNDLPWAFTLIWVDILLLVCVKGVGVQTDITMKLS